MPPAKKNFLQKDLLTTKKFFLIHAPGKLNLINSLHFYIFKSALKSTLLSEEAFL
jgi:hypothetical protein